VADPFHGLTPVFPAMSCDQQDRCSRGDRVADFFVPDGDPGIYRAHQGVDDGVAGDVAFKYDQFVVDNAGFGDVGQPGVIDVALDFARAEIDVGFDEVAETELCCAASVQTVKGVRQVLFRRGYGYPLIEPAVGRLTGPDSGVGRLPEPEDIFEAAQRVIAEFPKGKEHPSQTPGYAPTHPVHAGSAEDFVSLSAPSAESEPGILAGKRIVITAGGTREALDPVRFLGNRSTGKQGVALAQAARDMGASVHLIGANLEVPAPGGVELTRGVSAADLRQAVLDSISGVDALVMSAAVADFRPADYAEYKIKKTADPDDNPVIRLVRNPDILREVVQRRQQLGDGPRLIVGFAAETGSPDKTPLELGREKLTRKGCDFLAVNTVGISQGFGTDENTVTLISSLTDEAPVFSGSKGEVSRNILTTLAAYL